MCGRLSNLKIDNTKMKDFSDYSLLPHNTFAVDAKCRRFFEYESVEELQNLLPLLTDTPYLHIGAGSNLLFTKDYEGVVLHSAIKGKEVVANDGESVTLRVGAGECWDDFVGWCVDNGYFGVENLSYIPGEVGASAVQNIGAYGVEVEQAIAAVETIEVQTGEKKIFSHDECQYAYRDSIFKGKLKGQFIITYVHFKLSQTFSPNLSYGALRQILASQNQVSPSAKVLREQIIAIRKDKLPEVGEMGSAGSFFMNPVVSMEVLHRIEAAYPQVPHYPIAEDRVKLSAGWMIEQCGWKGRGLGKAGVYAKSALVLVNLGGAKGEEIVALAEKVRTDVRLKFGVEIHPEVNII